MKASLDDLTFENPFYQLPACLYTRVQPQPLENVTLRHINRGLADRLNIGTTATDQWAACINGDRSWGDPIAMKYMGHQFGHFNPDLGDGRGLLIGQIRDQQGCLQDMHVKGAGKTPFSRHGDGRAVLRSTLREYLMSAYLKALEVPTTEALALVSSEQLTLRECYEPTALLVRIADTHIRFGHFEYLGFTAQFEALDSLIDYVRSNHFPEAHSIEAWFDQVTHRTAQMIAQWQALGFCHGVMNTDNMSITGTTFDFGPYALMDRYDPRYICNHTDQGGRYAFNQQPQIALFNCYLLRCALATRYENLCPAMDASLKIFNNRWTSAFYEHMQYKLFGRSIDEQQANPFIDSTLALFEKHAIDYHYFFFVLTHGDINQLRTADNAQDLTHWLREYEGMSVTDTDAMKSINPVVILRNGFMQEVIQNAYRGEWRSFELLFEAIERPFTLDATTATFASPLPAKQCNQQLSCSS